MIRSKDLVLFVVILFFLGIAIFATLAHSIVSNGASQDQQVAFVASDDVQHSAYTEEKVLDRTSEVQRLREKLASENVVVEAVPSVETPVEDDEPSESGAGELLLCPALENTLAYARTWPLKDVRVLSQGSSRIVAQVTYTQKQTHASSSATTSVSMPQEELKTLLQLPLQPIQTAQTNCVPGEIVGVTTSGSLMFNNDARLYRNRGSEELLGYARDGYPIYGLYQGQTDECGGYVASGGYRYSISAERDYIIGCFTASVTPLN